MAELFSYSVTFEYETLAPETHRGSVKASSAATAMSRAVTAARKALKPVNWSSVVSVLLDRAPSASGGN